MKKFSTLLLCAALLIGCSHTNSTASTPNNTTPPAASETIPPMLEDILVTTGGDLLTNASPETSALVFYTYDGETVTQRYLFETAESVNLLNRLSVVPATELTDWSSDALTLPVYGIEIGGKDG